jgi:hypothetical protein
LARDVAPNRSDVVLFALKIHKLARQKISASVAAILHPDVSFVILISFTIVQPAYNPPSKVFFFF